MATVTERENWLRAIEFRGPAWIPVQVSIAPATWLRYGERLRALVSQHPRLLPAPPEVLPDPGALPGRYRAGEDYVDEWGCRWRNLHTGLEGIVVGHPLADWAAWRHYRLPDPLSPETGWPADWQATVENVRRAKQNGQLTWGYTDRFFERLHFLRGFENLMIDFLEGPPQLGELIDALVEYLGARVRKWIEAGVDVVTFGDDLGLQDRPMISVETFRRWLRPAYERLMLPCREAGIHVLFHSDGYILPLLPDFMAMGVSIVNPQDLVNGLENIAAVCKGQVCIHLDIDRQSILPFGTPDQVRAHVRRCVETLYLPAGGLSLIIGLYPDVPLDNLAAVLQAFEDYCLDLSWLQPQL
jgi:uroporphyrinogen decarboxylase